MHERGRRSDRMHIPDRVEVGSTCRNCFVRRWRDVRRAEPDEKRDVAQQQRIVTGRELPNANDTFRQRSAPRAAARCVDREASGKQARDDAAARGVPRGCSLPEHEPRARPHPRRRDAARQRHEAVNEERQRRA